MQKRVLASGFKQSNNTQSGGDILGDLKLELENEETAMAASGKTGEEAEGF